MERLPRVRRKHGARRSDPQYRALVVELEAVGREDACVPEVGAHGRNRGIFLSGADVEIRSQAAFRRLLYRPLEPQVSFPRSTGDVDSEPRDVPRQHRIVRDLRESRAIDVAVLRVEEVRVETADRNLSRRGRDPRKDTDDGSPKREPRSSPRYSAFIHPAPSPKFGARCLIHW